MYGVDDSDVVRFIQASLGPNTSGSFEWYFDGSDVDLTTNAEDIDALGFAPDGRLLISTTGNPSVAGVSGDGAGIFICAPGSLGSTTSCTFSMYWDGSLNGFAGEVIDGFDITSKFLQNKYEIGWRNQIHPISYPVS